MACCTDPGRTGQTDTCVPPSQTAGSAVCNPIRIHTFPPSGHTCVACERWAAAAACTASRAVSNAVNNPSPCVSTSTPPRSASAPRNSRRLSDSTSSGIASPRVRVRSVDAWRSVKRNVTVFAARSPSSAMVTQGKNRRRVTRRACKPCVGRDKRHWSDSASATYAASYAAVVRSQSPDRFEQMHRRVANHRNLARASSALSPRAGLTTHPSAQVACGVDATSKSTICGACRLEAFAAPRGDPRPGGSREHIVN